MTQLTSLNFRGCTALTTRSLHEILMRSPLLLSVCLKGLSVVTNTTFEILASHCQRVTCLNVGRCSNMDAEGIRILAADAISRSKFLSLKELRVSGLKHVNDKTMSTLARAAPYLEVLDLSYTRQLHNSALEAFVSCDEGEDEATLGVETVVVNARDTGRDANDFTKYKRRVTRLRHLSLSSCILITDIACSNLAHSVPNLEFLEMAGIGEDLKDEGLIRLLKNTAMIRRLDLEDASDITDAIIASITPSTHAEPPNALGHLPLEPGHALEQLTISYATNISDNALLALLRGCPKLKVLEADNTRIGAAVLKEFVKLSRERAMENAKIVAVDCRGINEPLVKELSSVTRPRLGWREYGARKLKYLDARDGVLEDLKVGQDECDEKRVVLKSFYSWQTVDAVNTAREKRRKAGSRRKANESAGSVEALDLDDMIIAMPGRIGTTRWWTPSARRSGRATPQVNMGDMNNTEGCTIM